MTKTLSGAYSVTEEYTLPSEQLLNSLAPVRPVEDAESILAHQAPDLHGLWGAWEEETQGECEVPFWGLVWPAARVMSQYMLVHPELVSGKRVLDIGAGGGVAAIAAVRAGAKTSVAADIDPVALHVTMLNAELNGVSLETLHADCADLGPSLEGADVILVADMFYEVSQTERLSSLLRSAIERGKNVLVADAERPFAPKSGFQLVAEERVKVDNVVEGVASRTVRLYELTEEFFIE